MTSMTAIKTYFGNEEPKIQRSFPILPITNQELIALKKIPPAEYEALAKGACSALGVEWEPTMK